MAKRKRAQSMRINIVYPVPCESREVWDIFKPFVKRFAATWKDFPPGVRSELIAVLSGPTNPEITSLLEGMNPRYVEYSGKGFDLGAQQFVAINSHPDNFMINFTTRVFFHREGWLAPLVRDRIKYGPGLYGASASREGSTTGPYVCTRGHSMDAWIFSLYPTDIYSRDQGVSVECGPRCLTRFVESIGLPARISFWESSHRTEDAINLPNSFRVGNQKEMLFWDRHTKLFDDSTESDKLTLHKMMVGI